MCAICGCSGAGPQDRPEHATHGEHEHVLADGRVIRHRHPLALRTRTIEVERDLLADNDAIAAQNRFRFAAKKTLVVNLLSSPGAGKTTLLEKTLHSVAPECPVAVIEGDQQTDLDAERIRQTGVAAVQVQTGKACHLDAQMVQDALSSLPVLQHGLLLIENVGNLVCPAGFDLGEHKRVVIASVTEGEDKPLKYPAMFASADLLVVSKTDLLPHLDFSVDTLVEHARRIRPGLPVILLSAKSGEGLALWLRWLAEKRAELG